MQKIRKRLRQEYSTTNELHKKILLERIKVSKEDIIEKYKEGRCERINGMAEEIENVEDRDKIWEFKSKLEKMVQTPYSKTDTTGIKLENRSDIQVEYTKYYKALLKTREPGNECESIIEEEVNKTFQKVIKTNQVESISDKMFKKAIAKVKNKRGSGSLGGKAEWLKEEGEEIAKVQAFYLIV